MLSRCRWGHEFSWGVEVLSHLNDDATGDTSSTKIDGVRGLIVCRDSLPTISPLMAEEMVKNEVNVSICFVTSYRDECCGVANVE